MLFQCGIEIETVLHQDPVVIDSVYEKPGKRLRINVELGRVFLDLLSSDVWSDQTGPGSRSPVRWTS